MILYDWTRVLSSVVEELRMFGLDDELELPLALPHALTVSSFLLIRSRSLFLWGSAHSQDKTSNLMGERSQKSLSDLWRRSVLEKRRRLSGRESQNHHDRLSANRPTSSLPSSFSWIQRSQHLPPPPTHPRLDRRSLQISSRGLDFLYFLSFPRLPPPHSPDLRTSTISTPLPPHLPK